LTVLNVITELKADEDYSAYYSDDGLCIELLEDGSAYAATSLICSYDAVQPGDVDTSDISTGIDNIDYCLPGIGVIPDLLCCPGWSTDTTVAALMDAKAASISGLFSGKALIDIDTSECQSYTDCTSYKSSHNLTGEDTILCWPMVKNGDYTFHMSTQLAGLMAQIDAENTCPYESPDNKNLKMDSTVLADGTEVLLSLAQANMLNGEGIVTALNFMAAGWVAWGSYTACYPSNTDVKDYIIPVSRMFSWVASTMIQTFWSKVGKPMNRRLLGTIVDTCNIWLNGLVKNQYLLGGRAEMLADENPDANLMAGIVKIHLYLTPPSPAQEIDFVLEYDADYVASALEI
ncbi:MAG: hypothetical protein LUD72_00830, partial [Bacteroidales bacterium]|nr:hypothetical protein [Bacteroidales bacterium]